MKPTIWRTLFFILLAISIVIGLYILFFKLNIFSFTVPQVANETVKNETILAVNAFDGVNIYTLDLAKIVSLGTPAISVLVDILKDENSTANQRWAAIMGLSVIGHDLNVSDKVLPHLKESLNDEDVNVRVTAATLVMSHGSKDGIPVLIAELENDAMLKPSEPPVPIKSYCAESLVFYTGQNFGVDKTKWQEWWDANKGSFTLE